MTQYFDQLKGFLQYGTAIVFVLGIFSFVGKSCLSLFQITRNLGQNQKLDLLAPSIGAAAISLPLVYVAQRGVAISNFVVWLVIVLLGLPLAVRKILSTKQRIDLTSRITSNIRLWSIYPLAAAAGLVPYMQLLVKPGFPAGFGTSATWTNNDLGVYIQMATNVGKSGVRDAGLVTGWNAGLQASFDHPSAHSFFVAVARILNREPYQVGIVLMATIVAIIFLASTFVVQNLSKSQHHSILLASGLVVINPPLVAAVTNFFYPQLFSISIVIGYLGLAIVVCRNRQSTWGPGLLAFLTTAVLLVSVEIAAVLIPLVTLFVFAMSPRNLWKNIFLKITGSHLVILSLLYLLNRELLQSQIDVLFKLSGSGVAGWKSNFVSPSMIFGLTPNQFAGPYSSGTRLLDAFIFFAIVAICVTKVYQERKNSLLVLSLSTLIGLTAFAIRKWGVDGYQTWKLITSLTPFFMLLFISLLLKARGKEKSIVAVAVAMFTVGATFNWTGSIWKDGEVSSYLNQHLAEILRLKKTSTQTGLNVLLAPYFETMAASVISGAPSRLSSPNYFNGGEPIYYRCTVTTEDKLSLLPGHGPIVAKKGPYILVGTPECD